MVDVMTDKQFKAILNMVTMILDGCESLEEAKEKINEIMPDRDSKKED